MYSNVDSLLNKRNELTARIAEESPDIIALTEIYPNNFDHSGLDRCELNIDGFEMYLGESGIDSNRGVILYIKSSLGPQSCDSLTNHPFRESVWADITFRGDKLLLGCVYRSPNCTEECNQRLTDLITTASELNYKYMLIMGDFNMRAIDWLAWTSTEPDTHFSHNFLEGLHDNFLYQHVLKPTRYRVNQIPSLLDLVLTNEENLVSDIKYRAPMGKSDHVVLMFDIEFCEQTNEQSSAKYIYHKCDYVGLRNTLNKMDWDNILNQHEMIDDKWVCFTNTLDEAKADFIPLSRGSRTPGRKWKPSWLNKPALTSIKKKHKAWHTYSHTRKYTDFQTYVKHRNAATTECRKSKKDFESKLASEVKDNPKAFWKYVKSKTKTRTGISDLVIDENTMTTTDSEKADVLNKFFCSVFTKEGSDDIPTLNTRQYSATLQNVSFTEDDVKEKLLQLNISKSAGPDGLHPMLLRECADVLCKPLYILMRESLDQGTVPKAWKEANISAIYKKGRKQEAGNYRPISLTSVVCKLFEKVIRKGITTHMDNNNLFSNQQHGFRNKRSTVTQLLETLDDWTMALDNSQNIDIIYLDFQKAFDTVPHRRLMNKLESYGIMGSVYEWIKSFLTDRKQRVCVSGNMSSWEAVTSGIPQGSVLGPILFVIFINDMPEVVSSMCKLFADDTNMYRVVEEHSDNMTLQEDLYNLSSWSRTWLLKFNENKCKRLHIGHTNPKFQYQLCRESSTPMEETTEEKDLGVLVDPELKFRKHINTIAKKANRIVGIIKRTFEHRDEPTITKLYCALIRPHLEYASSVWTPSLRKDITTLEKIQRRVTKLIPALSQENYHTRLTSLGLFSLVYRRRRGDMIHVYKMLHGMEEISADLLIEAERGSTRGHSLKLVKRRCSKSVRLKSFGNRVVNDWNSLPETVVTSKSLEIFKKRLDSVWEDIHFEY
jgi:hypothetical protein